MGYDFRPFWRDYKAEFSRAQHRKCGYCESVVIGVCVGDVEHYRPKGAVDELPGDKRRWGRERPDLSTVEGRDLDRVCDHGYWWYAWEWTNYLLACQVCNQFWKLCLFPVIEHPRCAPPRTEVWETPLLLNPFDGEDPVNHLHFDVIGQIDAWEQSEHGRATIDTCGLDRETLRAGREHVAKQVYPLTEQFLIAFSEDDLDRVHEIRGSLRHLGNPKAPHAGMVRAIFEHETGWSWTEVVEEEDP